jgi:hypothetical protein
MARYRGLLLLIAVIFVGLVIILWPTGDNKNSEGEGTEAFSDTFTIQIEAYTGPTIGCTDLIAQPEVTTAQVNSSQTFGEDEITVSFGENGQITIVSSGTDPINYTLSEGHIVTIPYGKVNATENTVVQVETAVIGLCDGNFIVGKTKTEVSVKLSTAAP